MDTETKQKKESMKSIYMKFKIWIKKTASNLPDLLEFVVTSLIAIFSLAFKDTRPVQIFFIVIAMIFFISYKIIKRLNKTRNDSGKKKIKKRWIVILIVILIVTFLSPFMYPIFLGNPADNYRIREFRKNIHSAQDLKDDTNRKIAYDVYLLGDEDAHILLNEYYENELQNIMSERDGKTGINTAYADKLIGFRNEPFVSDDQNADLYKDASALLDKYYGEIALGKYSLNENNHVQLALQQHLLGNEGDCIYYLIQGATFGDVDASRVLASLYLDPGNYSDYIEKNTIIAQSYMLQAYQNATGPQRELCYRHLLKLYIENPIPFTKLIELLEDGIQKNYPDATGFFESISVSASDFYGLSEDEKIQYLGDHSELIFIEEISTEIGGFAGKNYGSRQAYERTGSQWVADPNNSNPFSAEGHVEYIYNHYILCPSYIVNVDDDSLLFQFLQTYDQFSPNEQQLEESNKYLNDAVADFSLGNYSACLSNLLVSQQNGNIKAAKILGYLYYNPGKMGIGFDRALAMYYLNLAYDYSVGPEKEQCFNMLLDLSIKNVEISYADLLKLLISGYENSYIEARNFLNYICQKNGDIAKISIDDFLKLPTVEQIDRINKTSIWVYSGPRQYYSVVQTYSREREKLVWENSSWVPDSDWSGHTVYNYSYYTKKFNFTIPKSAFESNPQHVAFFSE